MTSAKWTGGVAEGEEHLLGKCKVLSSNCTPIKKNNRKKRKRQVYLGFCTRETLVTCIGQTVKITLAVYKKRTLIFVNN
jgi:hypothetical protein